MSTRYGQALALRASIPPGPGQDSGRHVLKRTFLIHIGDVHASDQPAVIQTTVGSCVAVCLYDPINHIGGMNHILLPGEADMQNFDCSARYGINAMELLINSILTLGGSRAQLVAKAFGGAHILPSITKENGVGQKNATFVMEFLRTEAIPVSCHDLGGEESRKVCFHTDTGAVFLKRFFSRFQPNIALEERRGIRKIRQEAGQTTDITWF